MSGPAAWKIERLAAPPEPVVAAARMRAGAGGGADGRTARGFVFLDSSRLPDSGEGPALSVIGRRPWRSVRCGSGCRADGVRDDPADIWAALRRALRAGDGEARMPDRLPGPDHLFGFLSYDGSLPLMAVPLPPPRPDDPDLPDAFFQSYDELAVYDHRGGAAWIIAGGRCRPAEESVAELRSLLGRPVRPDEFPPDRSALLAEPAAPDADGALVSNFAREPYMRAVERVREYIGAGDAYIVNLSRRITARAARPVWESYLRLRALSPVPYGAFFEAGGIGRRGEEPAGFALLSASMERFLRIRDGLAETRPIKGTRPRGRTPAEDDANRRGLLASEKDHAELLMIVDLERNDLSRVCTPESVAVRDLFRLEAYASVFHLDAVVEGRLAPGRDAADALAALFPGGSVTGAPKRRSMEIISELEGTRRGVYTGSLGWLSPDGDADFNILIRTLVRRGDRVWYSTGGGITWDSDPAAEYDETCDKAQFLERVV